MERPCTCWLRKFDPWEPEPTGEDIYRYEVRAFHRVRPTRGDHPRDAPVVLVARLIVVAARDFTPVIEAARLLNRLDPGWTPDRRTDAYWASGNRSVTYGDCFQALGLFWTIGERDWEVSAPPRIVEESSPGTTLLRERPECDNDVHPLGEVVSADWKASPWQASPSEAADLDSVLDDGPPF